MNPAPTGTLDTELRGIVSDPKRRLKWWVGAGFIPALTPLSVIILLVLTPVTVIIPPPCHMFLWRTGYFPWADMFIIG